MNILSKILIVAFISISLQSISAQDRINPVHTGGIVRVVSKGGNSQGTGFFVGPHTLVTAFHVIEDLDGEVSDRLFIVHPKTQRWIPVHSIEAFLSNLSDLAVLHISKYKSPISYELLEDSKKSLSSSKAYVLESRDRSFSIIAGMLSPRYYSETSDNKTLNLFDDLENLSGLSGSPIFSINNKVIGVLTRGEFKLAQFSNVKTIKELLLQPSLNCQSEKCFRDEIFLQQNTNFTEFHPLVSEDTKNDFREKLTWAQREIENKNFVSLEFLFRARLNYIISNYDFRQYIQDFAEQGCPEAVYELSYLYEEGLYGLKKDLEKARRLEQKASDLGYEL